MDTLTHCFEVLSVGFGNLEGGNGNGMAAQAHCGKVSIGQAGVVSVFWPCFWPFPSCVKAASELRCCWVSLGDNAGSQAASHLYHLQSRLFCVGGSPRQPPHLYLAYQRLHWSEAY